MTTLFDLFISPAHAQVAGTIGGFDIMSMLPLLLIFVVFYFFLIRPQQKKAQQQKALLSALRRGDRVLTSGGIIGVITKVINDQEVQVEIATNVQIRVARLTIADVLSKGEPVSEDAEKKTKAEAKKPTTAIRSIAKPAVRKVAPAPKVVAKKPVAPKKPAAKTKK